ncbi:hypothetical protein [Dysgonomonas gadei]|uniref:Uncharacterized protein n=1 Tax=Dysgonomonas gadei ATCC BAA-286 TaxID=742766 RepID=F5IX40_9BACT|nr:hypothetical protein [Dysgonomonas gadei]EGK02387.1 hypothetical protein HMPREF9455_01657 [Dysgonomonas gadei ATCC BAA-286]
MAILIEEKALYGRTNQIRKILLSINSRIAAESKPQQNNSVIIYAKDSIGNDPKALFKTSNQNIKAKYFEIWMRNSAKTWILQKLYFQLKMKKDINDYAEILAFHIDLDILEESYKKYPHIHIKHPEFECISNAHISLNLNDYLEITSSIEKFDKNFSKILSMIEKEFISKFRPN